MKVHNFNYPHGEVVKASQSLYQALAVAYLLKSLGDERPDIDHGDLGSLFSRLVNPPLDILRELESNMEPGAHDPDPGRHQPVLVTIGDKQIDAGGES